MESSLKKQYYNYYLEVHNLMLELSNHPPLLQDSNLQQRLTQLQACLNLPITEGSIHFLAHTISNLKQCMEKESNENKIEVDEWKESGYTKVKKSGNAFIPVEEKSKEIEVPNYSIPIVNTRKSLRQEPDYIFHDKPVRLSPLSNYYNRGSSHVFMLAFLTFLFESIFLVLAFFLYQ